MGWYILGYFVGAIVIPILGWAIINLMNDTRFGNTWFGCIVKLLIVVVMLVFDWWILLIFLLRK